ncbi:DUF7736 domain-containing protein [Delftia sp. RIT313]|uniref:DUF7736 domain-containing protein n=1 Tax=Delftia sp. RIT313 TaxID=1468410 RepID=UPI00044A347D|nr:hypothetical protein [Delftia sp. RIT313]EZP51429.1 hypothetical protein BW39_03898 [Delftia sp. RIT313]
MDIQRLRNLTTGRLHTEMTHIYQDIEFFTGEGGFMTHMLSNAMKALKPHLQEVFKEERLWDGAYEPSHQGQVKALPMTPDQIQKFWERYEALPSGWQ